MNAKSNRSVTKRPIKERKKLRSTKQRVQGADWKDTDERLTTPSDKLSQPVTRYR